MNESFSMHAWLLMVIAKMCCIVYSIKAFKNLMNRSFGSPQLACKYAHSERNARTSNMSELPDSEKVCTHWSGGTAFAQLDQQFWLINLSSTAACQCYQFSSIPPNYTRNKPFFRNYSIPTSSKNNWYSSPISLPKASINSSSVTFKLFCSPVANLLSRNAL